MSLYNMLHGANPLSQVFLQWAGFTGTQDIPRFRDTYLTRHEDEIVLGVYCRIGGGNREEYEDQIEDLRANPQYISDRDADVDYTYAHFLFRFTRPVEGELAGMRKAIASKPDSEVELQHWDALTDPDGPNPDEKQAALIDKMQRAKPEDWNQDPQLQHAKEATRPVMEKLKKAVDGEGPPIIEV